MHARSLIVLFRSVAVSGVLVLAAACGGGDDDDTTSPSSSSVADADGAASEAPTADELTAIATDADVTGFEADAPTLGAGGEIVERTYRNDGLEAFVTLAPCDPFRCWNLGDEVTPEHEDNLRSNLAPVHLENPDLVFEYGTTEPAPGYESFFVYSFSFVVDGGSKAAANSYQLIYHDGKKVITVLVRPESGFLPDTAEAFQAEMDQESGASAADEVFAAYADAFEPTT